MLRKCRAPRGAFSANNSHLRFALIKPTPATRALICDTSKKRRVASVHVWLTQLGPSPAPKTHFVTFDRLTGSSSSQLQSSLTIIYSQHNIKLLDEGYEAPGSFGAEQKRQARKQDARGDPRRAGWLSADT